MESGVLLLICYESEYYGVCTLEETISHHGIVEQKWGVRRYQNKDGTYTEEGKKRYGTRFDYAEKRVRHKLTNKYTKAKRETINKSVVRQRGKLTGGEAEQCINLAVDMYRKSFAAEPQITKDVISCVESSGGMMYDLDYRLKNPSSLAAKIGADAKEKNLSFSDSAKGIKDTIRYTSVADDDNFVSNYNSVKAELLSKGYTEVRCKNYFDLYNKGLVKHKSVQSIYKDKDGNVFEIQFQTPASQAAKDLKIPLYEERRKAGISDKRAAEIEQEMTKLAEHVNDPKGISKIKSH